MKKTTEKKYNEMLNVLPPVARGKGAFLVGEPTDHNGQDNAPRYQGYLKDGNSYRDLGLMTVYEFDDSFNVYDLKRLTSISAFDLQYRDDIDKEVRTGFAMSLERYWFDGRLKARHGRYQVDTGQDAPYYGSWININKLLTVEYVEGDIYICQYKSRPQLASGIKRVSDFRGIDGGFRDEDCKIVEEFCKEYSIENYKK